ncbi:MAG TPA: Clp protease N-terminal domain-containing protein [Dongiaceae bacterium]|nr:Clp protease N-terminal domain-containing protein [Dongiaceae bacterium]
MFERYTEKARRVIFFARLEAGNSGSHEIDTEHLLLGLLQAAKGILSWAPRLTADEVKARIEKQTVHLPHIPTSVDLPLSPSAKEVLSHATKEADGLGHKYIGTEHLFLGILEVKDCFASKLLHEGGANALTIREELAGKPSE